jgi:hypothetical protein
MSLEILAMLGLRELASSLVPGVPLETTGDVARLLTKMHDIIETFCRSFIALRDGYVSSVSATELDCAKPRVKARSGSAQRVGAARDPASLAFAMLDWRNQEFDAPAAVEEMLLNVASNQAALTEAVLRGVRGLLAELSPEAIEKAAADQPGLAAVFGRHKARWETFKARYDAIAEHARRADVMFGPEYGERRPPR